MKPALLIILCSMLLGCERHRSEAYEFPDGFHGWAVIVWGVPGHPQIPTDDGVIIVRFPADGVVITSTKLEFNAARVGSSFLDASQHRWPSIPIIGFAGNGFMHEDKSDRDMDYTQVFVGTKAEYMTNQDAPQVQMLWNAGISSHER